MDRLNKIERLKDELRATDYIAIKAYEGCDVSEHGDWIKYRLDIRDEINVIMQMTDEKFYEAYPDELEEITLDNEIEEIEEYYY